MAQKPRKDEEVSTLFFTVVFKRLQPLEQPSTPQLQPPPSTLLTPHPAAAAARNGQSEKEIGDRGHTIRAKETISNSWRLVVCHNKGSQKKGSSTSRRFYQEQLTKVVGQDVYLIEKFLDIPDEKKEWAEEHDMMYVKWLDYAEPSYIKKSDMTALKDIQ